MRDPNIIIAVISGILGGGFLSLIQYLIERHDKQKEITPEAWDRVRDMILAMTQDRIVYLGKQYLDKGCVTAWDKAMIHALYDPYRAAGGNHYAREIVEEVDKLPVEGGEL